MAGPGKDRCQEATSLAVAIRVADYFLRLCWLLSYRKIDAAQAIFKEDADPYMGMRTRSSHKVRRFQLKPLVSFPKTNAVGRVKSTSRMSVVAFALEPIT